MFGSQTNLESTVQPWFNQLHSHRIQWSMVVARVTRLVDTFQDGTLLLSCSNVTLFRQTCGAQRHSVMSTDRSACWMLASWSVCVDRLSRHSELKNSARSQCWGMEWDITRRAIDRSNDRTYLSTFWSDIDFNNHENHSTCHRPYVLNLMNCLASSIESDPTKIQVDINSICASSHLETSSYYGCGLRSDQIQACFRSPYRQCYSLCSSSAGYVPIVTFHWRAFSAIRHYRKSCILVDCHETTR